jgi:hypothetical protein
MYKSMTFFFWLQVNNQIHAMPAFSVMKRSLASIGYKAGLGYSYYRHGVEKNSEYLSQ